MIGFGLDLSGYATNRTSLAAVIIRGSTAEAVLLRNSAFSVQRTTDMPVQEAAEAEARVLKRCLDIGPVAVDIPIDLQNLLVPDRAVAIWELTRRPIDRMLNGMAPLADRIGAPVARFAAIVRKGGFESRLGVDLFETYPSENLRRLCNEPGLTRREMRECFCRDLSIERSLYDEDDLDALVCALAAAAPEHAVLTAKEFGLDIHELPRGFRILKRNPFDRISLRTCDFEAWMVDRPQFKTFS